MARILAIDLSKFKSKGWRGRLVALAGPNRP